MSEVIDDQDSKGGPLRDVIGVTRRIALSVIKIAGFGVESHWKAQAETPSKDHRMTFDESLEIITTGLNMIWRSVIPKVGQASFHEFELMLALAGLLFTLQTASRSGCRLSRIRFSDERDGERASFRTSSRRNSRRSVRRFNPLDGH